MAKGRAPVALTREEKKFIEENWAKMTDQDMADHLGRNIKTIRKFRTNNGLVKSNRGKSVLNPSSQKQKKAIKELGTEQEKLDMWRAMFIQSHRYNMLKDKYPEAELQYFIEEWAIYHLQFEDMTPSEEDLLETLINLKIRMADNQKSLKRCKEYEQELEQDLEERKKKTGDDLDIEDEEDRRIHEMIMSNNKLAQELNKEYKSLSDKQTNLLEALNATRRQREESQKIGAESFTTICESMQDKERRAAAGRYAELMAQSRDKKTAELKKPHKFADGQIEPIIMSGKDTFHYEDPDESETTEDE